MNSSSSGVATVRELAQPCINVSFALSGKQLPADHGYLLYSAIARATGSAGVLPASDDRGSSPTVREGVSSLHKTDWLGIELISGFPSGPGFDAVGKKVLRQLDLDAEVWFSRLQRALAVACLTLWRVKKKAQGPGLGENRRPDFQELLSDTQLAIWIRKGANENATQSLASRAEQAIHNPSTVSRFGGLSLGESTHLVDDITVLDDQVIRGRLLMAQDEGDLSLPIWPDHVGSRTRWGQYRLSDEADITDEVLDNEPAWTVIRRPALTSSTAN